MLPGFEFFSPVRIIFRRGALDGIGEMARSLGGRALLITGSAWAKRSGLADRITNLLNGAGVEAAVFSVDGEPSVPVVDEAAAVARQRGAELVIAAGGGSAIDAAKAAAVLAPKGGSALDYMEVVGRGLPLGRRGLPVIAIPTTAGTGAEATRNAVISDPVPRRKASLRHEFLLPRIALIDPALTDELPPAVTVWSGMDALTQLIEAYLSRRANPVTDALALEGIRLAVRALPEAFAVAQAVQTGQAGQTGRVLGQCVPQHEAYPRARDEMALAALLSGLCLGSAGLGVVHGLSGPIGGRYAIPHGLACAAVLPHAMRTNCKRLVSDAAGGKRVLALAAAFGLDPATPENAASMLASHVEQLAAHLRIPRLGEFGMRFEDIPGLARQALASSSTRSNPVDLSPEEVEEILRSAI